MEKTHRAVVNCKVISENGNNGGVFSFGSRSDPYVSSCHSHFAHVGGMSLLLTTFMTGGVAVVQTKFEIKTFLKAVDEHRIQSVFVVPSYITQLVRFYEDDSNRTFLESLDLSSLQDVLIAGEFLSEEISRKFVKYFKVKKYRQSFGLTESGFCTVIPAADATVDNVNSSGIPLPGVAIKIMPKRDEDMEERDGDPLNANQIGEIFIKTNQMSSGYLNNEKANRESYDSEGFLRTGDGGFINERGFLYVCDRFKEIIKVNGSQVSPTQLESILLTHPAVRETAVIGIPHEVHGHVPRAFVVLNERTSTSHNLIKTPGKEESSQDRETGSLCYRNCQESLPSFQEKHLKDHEGSITVEAGIGKHDSDKGRDQGLTSSSSLFRDSFSDSSTLSSSAFISQTTSAASNDVDDRSSITQMAQTHNSNRKTSRRQTLEERPDPRRDKESDSGRNEERCVKSSPSLSTEIQKDKNVASEKGEEFLRGWNLTDLRSDLLNFVSSQVSDHKRIRGGIFFLDSFPRTVLGKIDRKFLRTHYKDS